MNFRGHFLFWSTRDGVLRMKWISEKVHFSFSKWLYLFIPFPIIHDSLFFQQSLLCFLFWLDPVIFHHRLFFGCQSKRVSHCFFSDLTTAIKPQYTVRRSVWSYFFIQYHFGSGSEYKLSCDSKYYLLLPSNCVVNFVPTSSDWSPELGPGRELSITIFQYCYTHLNWLTPHLLCALRGNLVFRARCSSRIYSATQDKVLYLLNKYRNLKLFWNIRSGKNELTFTQYNTPDMLELEVSRTTKIRLLYNTNNCSRNTLPLQTFQHWILLVVRGKHVHFCFWPYLEYPGNQKQYVSMFQIM